MKLEVSFYRDSETGKIPINEWLNTLDSTNKARIVLRLSRVKNGNLGDYKPIGAGLFELRFHFGSGYSLYFGRENQSLILLLIGGNKSTQLRDINKAFQYWKKHLEES